MLHESMQAIKQDDPRFRLAAYLAVELGTAVRYKRLAKESNDELITAIRQWYRTGVPDAALFESLTGLGMFNDKMIEPIYPQATSVPQC